MLAVLLHSSAGWFDAIGLAFVLAAVAALGAFAKPRGRNLLIAFVVALVLTAGVMVAEAVYIPCPVLWKYLGIC